MVPVVVQYILSLVVSLPSSLWNHQSPNYQSNVWIENRPIMFMPLTQPTINLVRPFQLRVSWTSQSTAWNWGSRFISIPLCVFQFASTHTVIPHPCQRCSVELTPSCLAAYLWAADNCSLDNVKLAHTEEWGLLKKTVMMADFMQFMMRGFVQPFVFPIILQGQAAERKHSELSLTFCLSTAAIVMLSSFNLKALILLYTHGDIQCVCSRRRAFYSHILRFKMNFLAHLTSRSLDNYFKIFKYITAMKFLRCSGI